MSSDLVRLVVEHTRRVPLPEGAGGTGAVAARQLDAVLLTAGFKLSGELMRRLSGLSQGAVLDLAQGVLPVVRELAGDHVRHNVYFRDFPRNVPGTLEFWAGLLAQALVDGRPGAVLSDGVLDLLTLPGYGRYQHSYEQMLDAHEELIEGAGDRVTVLHAGGTVEDEAHALYLALAASTTPLGEDAADALAELAAHFAGGPHPVDVPVRENLAVINHVRVHGGLEPRVDTVTDVLRLACALSGGDVTLLAPTRFLPLRRPFRRALLAALDGVVAASPAKLGDVGAYRERWKRLGERLHPHEYPRYPHAAQVFEVARGERDAPSFAGRLERRMAGRDVVGAAGLLAAAPGLLFRSLDRLLRDALTTAERDAVLDAAERAAGRVSGRVLLSVREHAANRAAATRTRVFANRLGYGKVLPDTRRRLPYAVLDRLAALLDAEIAGRLPAPGHLLLDPAVLDVALPLTGKGTPGGLGVLPRGSLTPVDGALLRFFIYWRENEHTTDFDLSALMLDRTYRNPAWLSYTNLRSVAGRHSGDITAAPQGASEFIELNLAQVTHRFVIPQVNVFSGEGFEEVAESFFGFMLREAEQQGRPFEPRTVRLKSDLRGAGRVALPLAFVHDGADGGWRAKWMHLHLRGVRFNAVENNMATTSDLVRSVMEREYLTVRYLAGLMAAESTTVWDGGPPPAHPVTFIGLERPDGLAAGSRVVTPENLRDLIPE
ncbi:hypothetical protein [Actinomadura parmotrematis]|uniref:TerD family protein n=1 Tax=Actinomadura parmotrematis TaxID=2864039 RepID=A0ABS7FYX6_9ACTN|nr:hypothetical protein [Actinomadura parmotrematis]MBW8485643.1 hypothetical protein [Actinomadura parmotrematis]